ncbi:atrophin-1 [Ophiostoma piceae UAMH 11346]|uniref:Atrophin-1 n=1 Tax=Ophiostoma piceae (strain UAMH 11346) TaxID=1262450 RepID=S3D377_OPHP1|nr:atrophin-1 [Ophiostoma piceae UAMH 11346]
MIFSDLYKSPKSPFSKLRHLSSNANLTHQPPQQQPTLAELVDYGDPDLISRDKAKQKDAVRRYLAKHIRNDWDFVWPATRKSPEANAAAEARAAAIRRNIVQVEQVGLLQPGETFASPLSPVTDAPEPTTTVSLANISAAVADAADYDTESDSDAESVYSTISEDAIHFRPRAEWTSDFSDDDRAGSYYQRMPVYVHSPFRFDSPDAVGGAAAKNATPDERKAKARRDVRAEMAWNDGLACFNARRDAWTGAQTVRVKPAKPIVSSSPSSPRRSLFRFHSHSKSQQVATPAVSIPATIASSTATVSSPAPVLPLSPVMSNSRHSQYSQQSHQTQQSRNSQQSAGLDTVATTPITSDDGAEGVDGAGGALLHLAISNTAPIKPTRSRATQGSSRRISSNQPGFVQHPEYAVETLVPVSHPLLPPNNPMRQSITPALYLSLYDKLVTGLTPPSCPINLSDMIRSCVAGWKRDNEWPPRAEPPMMPTLRILPSSSSNTAAARRRKEGRTQPGGPFHRMRLLSKQPTVVLPTTTTATVGAAPATTAAAVDEKGDDITGNHGIRRSLQRVLGLNGNGQVPSPSFGVGQK